ncbi:terpene synthase family protein [Streptomyces jumonjinensis]|uniref:Terpene synthase n=1 Tax=Streptomyces jumonjinensis TaxID=1945 RepID=A0A646KIH8_STRJU|nr:terpene synthase family protein [Streptomyces jumonjinensis]MQT01871.1 hypothetical protein [Streptomyces jumonjinensis]
MMEKEPQFSLPEFIYPFPTVVSPYENDPSFHDESAWYDAYYSHHREEDLAKYRRQQLAQCAAYMSPTTTDKTHLRPMSRFLVWLTVIDDHCEFLSADEIAATRDRACAILLGADPRPDEIGYLRFLGLVREEFQEFMPYFWLERLAHSLYEYFTYGVMAEEPYKRGRIAGPPPLEIHELVHGYSIGMLPYGDMVEPGMGAALPVHVFEHGAIQRIRMLQCRLTVIQNDLYSLRKELVRPSEMFNIVTIIRHETGCSLGEAIQESIRRMTAYADEMAVIGDHLPDFGPHQHLAEEYVHGLKLQITGMDRWYSHSASIRYVVGGIPEPIHRP